MKKKGGTTKITPMTTIKKLSQSNWKKFSLLSMAMLLSLSVVGCRVEQTREGELPDVDVEVDAEPGQAPAYEVEGPDVEVGTTEETVEVPEVDVTTEEKTIEVPNVDVDLPGGEEAESSSDNAE